MTLLCPTHHREKTVGRLSASRVSKANAAPHNRNEDFTPGHPLYFDEDAGIKLLVGNNEFATGSARDRMIGIAVDGDYAVGVAIGRDGHPIIAMDIRTRNGEPRLRVHEGEMTLSTASWDVSFVGTRLTIHSAFRQEIINMLFDGPAGVVDIQSANFSLNRVSLRVGRQALNGGYDFPALRGMGQSDIRLVGGGVSFGEPLPPNGDTILHGYNVPRDS